MPLAMTFYPHERVFTDSPVELYAFILAIVGFLITFAGAVWTIKKAFHAIECHYTGCHRVGRHPHGKYKLCHIHCPGVPSDGRITGVHIDTETDRKAPTPARPDGPNPAFGMGGLEESRQ